MTQKIIFLDKDLDSGSIDNVISVAIDTETTGLNLFRDRLCLVQLCFNDERCYLIQIRKGEKYPNL
jgi:ribonuclease D